MPAFLPLSVVVIALNEAQRIGDCLASVRALTDDLIVVDAHSRDATVEIATAAGARVVTRAWTGYSEQKNHGNALARHDWILSLDADERVTPELAASLRAALADPAGPSAYAIRFENYFGATRVRFGAWNPEWHVRLFDRRKFHWNCDEVHEGLRALEPAAIGRLDGRIRHLTVASEAQLAAKTERYSELFAAKLRRQQRRPRWSKIWLNPAYRFIRDYLARGGCLDGRAGVVIAWEAARYTHLKYRLALPPAPAPTRGDWHWLRPALLLAAMAPLLAAFYLQPPRPATPRSGPGTTAPAATLVLPANDGFDNNPIVASSPPVDEDVLI